ncbi:MAG: hypothetical protein ACRDOO_08100 [Actinomadura sp.]
MRKIAPIAAALLAVAGCTSTQTAEPPTAAGGGTTAPAVQPRQPTEPRTEEAIRQVAQEEADSYAAGDYGAAWDLWTKDAKKAISRSDYERLFELCPPLSQGVRFTIEKITMAPDKNSAKVRFSRIIGVFSYKFVYEDGHWRFVPDADAMRDYRIGDVRKIAARARAEGRCAA